MTIPANASSFEYVLDPADVQDFTIQLTRGGDATDMLRTGEKVASYVLAPSAESVAAGLQILSTLGYQTKLLEDGQEVCEVHFWATIDPAKRQSALFNSAPILGVELTTTTDNVPPRVKHRTYGLKVAGQ